MAKSYAQEHIDRDGNFDVLLQIKTIIFLALNYSQGTYLQNAIDYGFCIMKSRFVAGTVNVSLVLALLELVHTLPQSYCILLLADILTIHLRTIVTGANIF